MSLAAKLLEVQKEIGTVKKGSINPYFKSKYVDINGVLEVLTPELQKRGVLLTQPLSSVNGSPAITTTLTDTESGEIITDTAVIPTIADPQKAGGCITYFRRYALISLMGFGAEDDDANVASGNKAKTSNAAPKGNAKKTSNTNDYGM